MSNLIEINGIMPTISDTAWIADNATISGDVTVGEGSSIWFQVRNDPTLYQRWRSRICW